MTAVRPHSSFIRAGALFKVPILSWTPEVPSRFFRALHGALNKLLYIQPSDFVAPGGVSLGDCSAALRIFGGNSTLTLRANGVIADFPAITPERIRFANSVIFQGYQALRTEFTELEIGSIQANAGHHLEVVGDTKAHDILAATSQAKLQKHAQDIPDILIEPGMRFRIVSKDGKWNCRVTGEKSEAVQNGVFLLRELVVSDLTGYESTQQQFDLVERIDEMILELVGLKFEAQWNDGN